LGQKSIVPAVADDEYEEQSLCCEWWRKAVTNVEDENKRHSRCGLMKAILRRNNKDVAENTTNTQVHWK
jgi:hypothetical protein